MARVYASITAAVLMSIAACNSTTNENTTFGKRNRNLEGTVQSQRQRIDQLVEENTVMSARLKELQARADKDAESTDVVEKAKEEISAHVKEMLARFQTDAAIKIEATAGGYRLILTERVLFASGSVKLSKEGMEALGRIASALKGHNYPAVIEGHTDNVPVALPATLKKYPRGNIELSAQRALAVWEYLVKTGRVKKTRLSITGHGPNRPRAGNETDFERWHNRRVEIVVIEAK